MYLPVYVCVCVRVSVFARARSPGATLHRPPEDADPRAPSIDAAYLRFRARRRAQVCNALTL